MLSIFVGDTGSLQARRGVPFVGQPGQTQSDSGMFFPGGLAGPASNFWHLRVTGAPAANVTFGPRDTAVTTISNGPVLGDWSAESPARVSTVMRIQHGGVDLFEVTQTVLYVAAEVRFRAVWDVRNLSAQAIPFVFGTSADLFIESDAGEGVLLAGPPRFLGGRNKFSGTIGGVAEVGSSQLPGEAAATAVAPWASYEEGDPFPVTHRLGTQDAFANTLNPLFMDNGVGVSFGDHATAGLAAGETARYEVIWHHSRPAEAITAASQVARLQSPSGRPAEPPPPPAATEAAPAATDAAPAVARPVAPVGGDGADTSAPVIRSLKVSAGAARASTSRRAPRISFRLSEPANVLLRIVRRTAGRRVTVRKATRANLPAGFNSARIGGRRLPRGSYVISARPVDTAGNSGAPRSAAFRIRVR
ncbi:MAG TPA: hypothetical protein VM266_16235 [Solirubrobacteraceae bacterium]|nr:hypothetical protein [Solirubrobacteraceae bacterium]